MSKSANIADLIDRIDALGPDAARDLLTALESLRRADPSVPRCPARHNGVRCVRDEDHIHGHVASNGEEWLIALRCHLGVGKGASPICARLAGHEGDCVPRPQPVRLPDPLPEPRPRCGICRCGKERQEHEGATHTGGCAESGCARYKP